MINSVIENDNKLKSKIKLNNIIDEMYLLPKWEKIKSFNITETFFLFWEKAVNLNSGSFHPKTILRSIQFVQKTEKIWLLWI